MNRNYRLKKLAPISMSKRFNNFPLTNSATSLQTIYNTISNLFIQVTRLSRPLISTSFFFFNLYEES